ncbi:MAG: site-specific DNA-methyltransferase [Candidatus Poribacteria bacterium]|nr:site-specific DNA-methyltransferase [Candidatus Poribacteria bacterium]
MTKTVKKVQKTTTTPNEERLKQLKQLYPECLTEGEVDIEKLKDFLSTEDIQENGDERYSFTWAKKSDAIRNLNTPTEATLKPARDDSLNFDTSSNLFIEGENLAVLKLLYKPYFGCVKAIYIDPPYNTGKDFIYPDNFREPLDVYYQLTGQVDSEGNLQTSNPETSGRYHSTWLSMMYPRLFYAHKLLAKDGIMFISIDDHEFHNLRFMLNEIFGEENFIGGFVWRKKAGAGADSKLFFRQHEHILMYSRNIEEITELFQPLTEKQRNEYKNPDNDPRGLWASTDLTRTGDNDPARIYEVVSPTGKKFTYCWTYTKSNFQKLIDDNRIWWGKNGNSKPKRKRFLKEKKGLTPRSWVDIALTQDGGEDLKKLDLSVFDYPKPVKLIKLFLQIATDTNDLILDFFAGSCTTAQTVLELNQEDGGNRQFIMIQLPEPTPENSAARKAGFETIAEIGKERIRRVCQKSSESTGFRVFKLAQSNYKTENVSETDDLPTLFSELEETLDPLREGWQKEDVLYEIALKEGYPLDSTIRQVEGLATNSVFCITAPNKTQSFHVCLDEELTETDIEHLDLSKDSVFICRDVALNDTLAANLALECRFKTI